MKLTNRQNNQLTGRTMPSLKENLTSAQKGEKKQRSLRGFSEVTFLVVLMVAGLIILSLPFFNIREVFTLILRSL